MNQNGIFTNYLKWYNDLSKKDDLNEDELVFFKYFKYILKVIKEYYDKEYFLDMLQEAIHLLYVYYKRFWSEDFDRSVIDDDVDIAEKKYILKMIRWGIYQYIFKIKYPITLNSYTFKLYYNGEVELKYDIIDKEELDIEGLDIEEQVKIVLDYLDRRK